MLFHCFWWLPLYWADNDADVNNIVSVLSLYLSLSFFLSLSSSQYLLWLSLVLFSLGRISSFGYIFNRQREKFMWNSEILHLFVTEMEYLFCVTFWNCDNEKLRLRSLYFNIFFVLLVVIADAFYLFYGWINISKNSPQFEILVTAQ